MITLYDTISDDMLRQKCHELQATTEPIKHALVLDVTSNQLYVTSIGTCMWGCLTLAYGTKDRCDIYKLARNVLNAAHCYFCDELEEEKET